VLVVFVFVGGWFGRLTGLVWLVYLPRWLNGWGGWAGGSMDVDWTQTGRNVLEPFFFPISIRARAAFGGKSRLQAVCMYLYVCAHGLVGVGGEWKE